MKIIIPIKSKEKLKKIKIDSNINWEPCMFGYVYHDEDVTIRIWRKKK